jgi:glycosyltransferase involved in cell wall biosynthesis
MKTVSIIIPCRNEEQYIGSCLDSLLANDYPRDELEIIVVDGMSTDRTREIVGEYCKNYPFIKMIDNPWHIKPKALNIGIESTKSDVVMRIDAHAVYAKDYISKLLHGLFQYNTDNIGGIRETYSGDTPIANAIAAGISHSFSVGNAYWRTGTKSLRKVDTVFCGCYRREVFDRIGLFNEKLIRTQDKEFNSRLIKGGGTIMLDPSVECTYFPRTKLRDHLKWIFTGASWLFYAWRFTSIRMASWRNYVPLAFLLYSLFFLIVLFSTFYNFFKIITVIPLAVYLSLSLYFSVEIAFRKKDLLYMPLLFLIFPATHYSYALGSLYGIIKARVLGKDKDI